MDFLLDREWRTADTIEVGARILYLEVREDGLYVVTTTSVHRMVEVPQGEWLDDFCRYLESQMGGNT